MYFFSSSPDDSPVRPNEWGCSNMLPQTLPKVWNLRKGWLSELWLMWYEWLSWFGKCWTIRKVHSISVRPPRVKRHSGLIRSTRVIFITGACRGGFLKPARHREQIDVVIGRWDDVPKLIRWVLELSESYFYMFFFYLVVRLASSSDEWGHSFGHYLPTRVIHRTKPKNSSRLSSLSFKSLFMATCRPWRLSLLVLKEISWNHWICEHNMPIATIELA